MSATTGEGIDGLIRALKAAAGWQDGATGQFTARRRHLVGLEQTMQSLRDAEAALQSGADGELMAEDLKRAQTFLGELVGDVCPDELLGRIFSSFCIGK